MNRNTVSIRPRSTIHHHNNNGLQHHMNHPPSPPTTRLVSPLSIRSVLAIPTTTTTTTDEIFPTSTLPIEGNTDGIRNPPPPHAPYHWKCQRQKKWHASNHHHHLPLLLHQQLQPPQQWSPSTTITPTHPRRNGTPRP